MKRVKMLTILALLAFNSISTVIAEVSHISIDTIPFESGQTPKLTVNVITDHHDLSRLTFYLRQIYKDNIVLEKLDVERRDNDVFLLTGTEKVRDQDAALIVSEFRNAKWLQYSPVALFSQTVAQSKHQPVAIKTMKSSATLSTLKPTPISHQTSVTPQVATTQRNLSDCQVNHLASDTLWKIAVRYRKQWNSNIYGAMLALYETNPSAFYQDKISQLKVGSALRCPSVEMLSRYQNVAADKVTFDNVVASQGDKSQQVSPSDLPVTASMEMPQATQNDDSLNADSKELESKQLLAAIHETQTLPQPILVNVETKMTLAETDRQSPALNKSCLLDKLPQDTLWRVADRYYRQWQISVFGAMLAIYDANPNAFANQKIYLLMSDSRLKCPSEEIVQQYQNSSNAQATYDELVLSHKSS